MGSRSEQHPAEEHFLICFIALLLLSTRRCSSTVLRKERIGYRGILLSSFQLYTVRKHELQIVKCRRSVGRRR